LLGQGVLTPIVMTEARAYRESFSFSILWSMRSKAGQFDGSFEMMIEVQNQLKLWNKKVS